VKDVLNQLNPPNTFTGILWDKIKDPVNDVLDIGQFIAISNFASSAFSLNSASWNLSLAQTRAMGTIANAYRTRIATQFVGDAVMNATELGLNAMEVAEVEEQASLAAETMGGEGAELTAGIDTAIEGAVVAEEALAAAATGCVVAVAVVLIVAGAQWLWNKHKESEEADKLRSVIVELCTARLFVAQTEQISQTFVALSKTAKQITQGIIDKQPVDDLRTLYMLTAKDLQLDSSTDMRLNELYESLKAQDNGINTAEDPDLPTMKTKHQIEVDTARVKADARKAFGVKT